MPRRTGGLPWKASKHAGAAQIITVISACCAATECTMRSPGLPAIPNFTALPAAGRIIAPRTSATQLKSPEDIGMGGRPRIRGSRNRYDSVISREPEDPVRHGHAPRFSHCGDQPRQISVRNRHHISFYCVNRQRSTPSAVVAVCRHHPSR